ncbi:hypothetical protein GCM10018780_38260 [Streptomyces lanatus]|nr:hypothetical protein GCM10018780_38260 [Streptomyces lanatus]
MFVQTFEKGKGDWPRPAGDSPVRGDWPEQRRNLSPLVPLEPLVAELSRTALPWGLEVAKGVYRLVITLEGESGLPGWFAGDSVGNSDLATS